MSNLSEKRSETPVAWLWIPASSIPAVGKAATRTPHEAMGAILNPNCRVTPASWVHLSGFNLEVDGEKSVESGGKPEVTAASLQLSMCASETVALQHPAAKFGKEPI